ncbi:Uncharacterised protein [Salmonella enterica subsp. enterica serovar Typhimurium str. DT104]|nr:Uncharacterised protein [Salmonella enterica subsp. enterica serovar Typhimurium str. DT104]CQM88232.1 Uncharacterised protein [Salmonella enterica subsp. enterica serovar Typhimurium str. DT104]CQP46730.1 Uncharacterised protein [Salmonella enterica subsp. enterica serovar Typhimurium str. DT104]
MDGHQRGTQRNGQLQQRGMGLFSDRKRQWDEQHDAHFHEQRDTANQPHQYHDHVSREPAAALERKPDAFRRAGNLHHFAEDGAKTDNGGQKTERTAYSVFYRRDHLQRPHAHHRADKETGEQ